MNKNTFELFEQVPDLKHLEVYNTYTADKNYSLFEFEATHFNLPKLKFFKYYSKYSNINNMTEFVNSMANLTKVEHFELNLQDCIFTSTDHIK